MDPLSVGAGVTGVLAAALQISQTLAKLIQKSKLVPKAVQELKYEIDTTRSVLGQLQLYIQRKLNAKPSGASLIPVQQVLEVLGDCVLVFSQLDVLVGQFDSDSSLGLMDRLRWMSKADAISEMSTKLQGSKISLVLILSVLQGHSQVEAEASVAQLCAMVEGMRAENRMIHSRLLNIDYMPSLGFQADDEDHQSSMSVAPYGFEADLQRSRVYKRTKCRADNVTLSLTSTAGRSATWSLLSGLSLSDVSQIAVISLPIYAEDLQNREHYDFGEQLNDLNPAEAAVDKTLDWPFVWPDPSGKIYATSDLKSVKTAVEKTYHHCNQHSWSSLSGTSGRASGFWPDIHIVERGYYQYPWSCPSGSSPATDVYIPFRVYSEETDLTLASWLPRFVADIGMGLIVRGVTFKDTFLKSGFTPQIQRLCRRYETAPYGRDVAIDAFSPYDAASCLLRYLKLKPQPVVPYHHYEDFCRPKKTAYKEAILSLTSSNEIVRLQKKSIVNRDLQFAVAMLPESNRILLIFLMNMLYRFSTNSAETGLTIHRLVGAFQPCILAQDPEARLNTHSEPDQDFADRVCEVLVLYHVDVLDMPPYDLTYKVIPDIVGRHYDRVYYENYATSIVDRVFELDAVQTEVKKYSDFVPNIMGHHTCTGRVHRSVATEQLYDRLNPQPSDRLRPENYATSIVDKVFELDAVETEMKEDSAQAGARDMEFDALALRTKLNRGQNIRKKSRLDVMRDQESSNVAGRKNYRYSI